MKIWDAQGVEAAQVPLLQTPLAAEQLPPEVLQALDARLQERARLDVMADQLLGVLQPRVEALAAAAVRQQLRDAWQQRYPSDTRP